MEKTGAAWSSETMTRRPFLSLVSVNWILRSGAAPTPSATMSPRAQSRLIEMASSQVLPGSPRRNLKSPRVYRWSRGPHGSLVGPREVRLAAGRGTNAIRGRAIQDGGIGQPEAEREAPCESADV